jgi:hypothetical protein
MLFLLFSLSVHLFAQAIPAAYSAEKSTSTTTSDAGPAGIIPAEHGFNAALSVNATVPIYTSVNAEINSGTKAKPIYTSTTKHGIPGDAAISAILDTHPGPFDYTATATVGLPSGNTTYGLGAGKPTYALINHFEKSLGMVSPDIEFGLANSSDLTTARTRKSYTAVGELIHFQAGTSVDLPRNMSFEADAYEDMPISTSTLYSVTRKGKKKATTTPSSSAAEDNGINTALDIPLNRHTTFSGFYNHSIRSQYDVVGFSLTFLLKAPPSSAR